MIGRRRDRGEDNRRDHQSEQGDTGDPNHRRRVARPAVGQRHQGQEAEQHRGRQQHAGHPEQVLRGVDPEEGPERLGDLVALHAPGERRRPRGVVVESIQHL
jgi:hypothetical protein